MPARPLSPQLEATRVLNSEVDTYLMLEGEANNTGAWNFM